MKTRQITSLAISLLLIAVMLTGCVNYRTYLPVVNSPQGSESPDEGVVIQPPPYWPTKDWQRANPEDVGMNPDLIEDMLNQVQDENINLHSVVIVRRGYIVGERYYSTYQPDDIHPLWSVTKSVVSTLIGIAIDEGLIPSVDTLVSDYFPEVIFEDSDPRKAKMTLEHLLSMSSGLDWSDEADIALMYNSPSWPEYVLGLELEAEPGKQFNYNSGNTHVLSAIIEKSAGMSTLQYAQERLFEPLGISDLTWDQDRNGTNIGGWGLSLTPRDMAKIGYLYLNGGYWDGRQIISEDWVRRSIQKKYQLEDPIEPWGLWYGYGWWIHEFGPYAAHGRGGQFIFVDPPSELVVVYTSELSGPDFAFPATMLRDYLIPAAGDG